MLQRLGEGLVKMVASTQQTLGGAVKFQRCRLVRDISAKMAAVKPIESKRGSKDYDDPGRWR
jgi:hypothetical protein